MRNLYPSSRPTAAKARGYAVCLWQVPPRSPLSSSDVVVQEWEKGVSFQNKRKKKEKLGEDLWASIRNDSVGQRTCFLVQHYRSLLQLVQLHVGWSPLPQWSSTGSPESPELKLYMVTWYECCNTITVALEDFTKKHWAGRAPTLPALSLCCQADSSRALSCRFENSPTTAATWTFF